MENHQKNCQTNKIAAVIKNLKNAPFSVAPTEPVVEPRGKPGLAHVVVV